MRVLYLLAAGAAMAALGGGAADAQSRPVGGARISYPSNSNHFSWERGHHRGFHGFGPVFVVEREVPVIVERPLDDARDERVKMAPPPAPSPEGEGRKRKPYVVGATYASLPGGCMKMIEGGASYYFCGGGEWYQLVGSGRSATYKAIDRKL